MERRDAGMRLAEEREEDGKLVRQKVMVTCEGGKGKGVCRVRKSNIVVKKQNDY